MMTLSLIDTQKHNSPTPLVDPDRWLVNYDFILDNQIVKYRWLRTHNLYQAMKTK